MIPKLTYIISDLDKSLGFEWLADELSSEKFDINFILINQSPSQIHQFLIKKKYHSQEYLYKGRLSLILIFLKIFWSWLLSRPSIIHSHLHNANLIALTAGWLLRIPRRIFTRHHALVHYEEHPSGLKWDKWCNSIATDIVAISKNVETILISKDGADPKKIHLIHHGFKLSLFKNVSVDRINKLKLKYGLDNSSPIIGVIARHVEWKGIQCIIPAFKKILLQYPTAKLVLANASGPYHKDLNNLLSSLPKDNYVQIRFENDLPALYSTFDVYIHTPINEEVEAFGQTYIEALASQCPSIFTFSGVGREILKDNVNCLKVPFKDTEAVYEQVIKYLTDQKLKERIVKEGVSTAQAFELNNAIKNLEILYGQKNCIS